MSARTGTSSNVMRWSSTLAATAASNYALDAIAMTAGVALVASQLFRGADHMLVLPFLASTYVAWGAGMRVNLEANWNLLEKTGTSTNVLSKAAHELTSRWSWSARNRRIACGVGYVVTALAMELPYYVGAFGVALLSDTVSSNEVIIFLGGANLGAAGYEYAVAWATRAFLDRQLRG